MLIFKTKIGLRICRKVTLFIASLACILTASELAFAHGDEHGSATDLSQYRKKKKSRFSAQVGVAFADKITSGFEAVRSNNDEGVMGQQHNDGHLPQDHHEDGHPQHSAMAVTSSSAMESGETHAAEHSHDHSSAHGFGTNETKLFTKLGYAFTPTWDVTGSVAASPAMGLDDPSTALGS